jgi:hypothetical protein
MADLDRAVQDELTRVALDLGAALLREAIERRSGRRLADMQQAEALQAIRELEAERRFRDTDELIREGREGAGAADGPET